MLVNQGCKISVFYTRYTINIFTHISYLCLKGKSIKHWIALDRESTPGDYHCSLRPEQGSRNLSLPLPNVQFGWKWSAYAETRHHHSRVENCGRNWWIRLGEAVHWTKRTMSDTVECPNWSPNNREFCTSLWPRIKAMYVSQICHWHTWFNSSISEKSMNYFQELNSVQMWLAGCQREVGKMSTKMCKLLYVNTI